MSGWLAVAGARPNFVKLASLVAAARRARRALPWVHTGQHRADALSGSFLRTLRLPAPVAHLGAAAGSPTSQTARILSRLEPVLRERRPSVLVVFGDVTSTLAGALAGVQARVPVAHVEAGLRSFDLDMPEEWNRVLVDRMSERLYASEPAALENLRREGVPRDRVALVGSVAIDTLRRFLPAARASAPAEGGFALATLHRAGNVDSRPRLSAWVRALAEVARRMPVVFPVHPRTAARLRTFRLAPRLSRAGVRVLPPLSYLDFLGHALVAAAVLTDSGGVQQEASFLGVPCLTLRDTTEHPVTVTHGTNVLVGADPARLLPALSRALARRRAPRRPPRLWDGHASERVVADLARRFA